MILGIGPEYQLGKPIKLDVSVYLASTPKDGVVEEKKNLPIAIAILAPNPVVVSQRGLVSLGYGDCCCPVEPQETFLSEDPPFQSHVVHGRILGQPMLDHICIHDEKR